MNRLFRSLMLSTFILSNVLAPLSYANLEEDLFEDDLLSKSGQEIIETQVINNSGQSINDDTKDQFDVNSGTENTEIAPENINNNYEDVDTEDLVKPENNITVSEVVTGNCFTFDKDTQTITAYDVTCGWTDVVIPAEIDWVEVKIIWWWNYTTDWAFYNKWLKTLIFPDTVTTIKQNAFTKNNLTVVYFGNWITSIERYGFFSSASWNPVVGIVPKDLSLVWNHSQSNITLVRWYKVTYKDWDSTFETSVTTWIVENLPWTKEWYELSWWYADSELSTQFDFDTPITADTTLYGKWNKIYTDECYTFNEWTQTITDYNASCSKKVVIPSSFDGVEVKIIWESAFRNKWLTSVTIPNTVTEIQKYAFLGNSLTSVNLWESITAIGWQAFQWNQLQSIYIPNSVTYIYSLAFAYNQNSSVPCSQGWTDRWNGVEWISLIDGKTYWWCVSTVKWYKVTYIDSWTTVKTAVTTWIVEDYSLDAKEWYLFDAWYKDQNYTEKFDFSGTQVNPITEDTTLYAKWDEIVRTDDWCYEFNKDKKTIIWFGWTWTCGTDIEIPSQIDGVTVEAIWWWELVKDWAFDYEWLTSVKIPDTIKEIQQNAFVNNQLAYISLWNSIEKIWRHAFQGNKLTTIYIPSSVTEIWNWAFSWNAVADVPCSTYLSGYWYWVVWVYLSGDDTQLFSKDTCLQFQQWYSVKYMDWNSIYREDVSTWSVKNIELTWKDYYDFSGWYTDNTFSSKFDFSTIITWNISLYAYWTPIIYHITYELNNWINNPENPSTYTVESSNIILKDPTKARHSFLWWTNVDITTPTMSIIIKSWSTGDRSYTANWKENGFSWRWKITPTWDNNKDEDSSDSDIKNNEDKNNENKDNADSNPNWDYDQELLDAYNWAVKQWLTNSTFEDLLNEWELTRAEMAKIAVKYVQMLWLEKKLDEDVSYPDVDSSLWELENYIKLAYQYQVMWIHADGSKLTNFKPNKFVSRGEFATVFSRILHGFEYNINWANYYEKHLEVLKSEWILNDTNPARVEEKKWVILMMYRYQKK